MIKKDIAQQIDWANDKNYWEGRYCLANNNCEHRTNSFVYGINFSKQVQERPNKSIDNCKRWRGECNGNCKSGIVNNSKGSTINLKNEINQTDNQQEKVREIKDSESEWWARIEVPARNWL